MKHYLQRIVIIGMALIWMPMLASAQQVNTMYFMENLPMRHVINPAFQPVSSFYLTLPAIGYTSLWVGNNGMTMQDLIFRDAKTGNTITALHPNADNQLYNRLPKTLSIDMDFHINLFSFGWRVKEKGYAHFNIAERANGYIGIPKTIFGTILGEGISNNIDVQDLNAKASLYTEIALGYSHRIDDQWTVGGKLKVLLGHTYIAGDFNKLNFSSSNDIVSLSGNGSIKQAGIIEDLIETGEFPISSANQVWQYLVPVGVGGAVDLGVTYKPLKQLQVSASVSDLGGFYWQNGSCGQLSIDTSFVGIGNLNYGDYVYNGQFQVDSLTADITNNLQHYADALHVGKTQKQPFGHLLYANLNIGIDGNFWKNRVGVGVYSRTRFYENHVTEEVTIGAALRPCNWFNLAVSYSFMNGKWSNLGAAISLATYDGFMFSIAADYVPLSYASSNNYAIPYKTKGLNVAFGIAIVAGTNRNKKTIDDDADGIYDIWDMCLNTPAYVRVDDLGCPMDSDGDGVPDYMDECPNTSSRAYGLIDSVGCPIDSDYDGVPDYTDRCPNTLPEARNYVDELGCVLDTDGDGVPDYVDQCPGTPAAAYAYVDEYGCPLDSDGDGVADYIDQCPNTPTAAYGKVDAFGCPIDTDRDGVVDYLDQCPNTPAIARNHVNEVGCMLDTDGDGIYDYEDLCPTIAGVKSASGCPEVKREVRNVLNKAMTGVQFENGKATIKKTSYAILDQVAKIFIENPSYLVEVQGHTDNVGNYQYNLELSERRAQAVREYLVNKGVNAENITAHGYGSDRPIADNNTKKGRSQNRRVEFNISFE